MSTARAGWCCSDNSPHRPTVDRSLALCTVPFVPTPMPPVCPNTYVAPFSSPPPTLPNAVSSPTLFECVCVPTAVTAAKAPLSPNPLPLLALCSPPPTPMPPPSFDYTLTVLSLAHVLRLRARRGRPSQCVLDSHPSNLCSRSTSCTPRQLVLRASADGLVAAERSAGVNARG